MTLFHRRILYIIFILLFLVITPAILFYAAGYNFNFQSGAVERTGILIIKTDPRGAQVHLGDKKKYNWLYTLVYGEKPLLTPLNLRNLLPDDYNITISKDGYFDYHKKITLYPGQTVVLDTVTLLKKSAPEPLASENVIKTALAPDGSRLAAVTDTSLIIVDLNSGQMDTLPLGITATPADAFDIVWSPTDKKILLTLANWPVFNLETGTRQIALGDFFPVADARAHWDSNNSNTLLLRRNGGIYSFDLAKKKSMLLFTAAGLQDFLFKDGNFYTVETRQTGSAVVVYDDNSFATLKTISLPGARSYEFKNTQANLLYVYEPSHALLYVIDPFSFVPLQASLSNVKDFSVSGNTLLYWNEFEIWSYDSANKINSLLTRISRPIGRILLDDSYIIYNTPAAITSFERDVRDSLNATDILDWQETSDLTLNVAGTYLYFVSPQSGWRALWRLAVK
jgi:hypothetical protein